MSARLLPRIVIAAAIGLAATPAAAADAVEHTITVSGQGEATTVPDQADLSAGVATIASTANAALADNARKMTTVFDALKRRGVPERAIQTSNFSVQPQYAQNPGGDGPSRITGYQVSNQVDVTLNDVKTLGPALDALVAAGANQINSVGYSIKDQMALQTDARMAAIADARKRAETYAKAAGVGLGGVIAIQEGEVVAPRPMNRVMAFAASAITPTAAGEMSVTATVTVVFELK